MRQDAASGLPARPLVFLGPSMPVDLARQTLPEAVYRSPIRRGDLDGVPAGSVVAIIDGVFAQTLAISPGEIRDAIDRGVVVYGAASMGALRAAENPNVVGVGRVFEMYRAGLIERDDEVALLFDPDTYRPLTEPMVNVRYAVDRLVRSATLSREAGQAVVHACSRLHYTRRTYPEIFRASSLAANGDVDDIIGLLRKFDLKREDAQFLLETLALREPTLQADSPPDSATPAADSAVSHRRVRATEHSDAPILIWESGDTVAFDHLIRFLKVTGQFERIARNVLARYAIAGRPLRAPASAAPPNGHRDDEAQQLLDSVRLVWGWESPEEAHVTMRDLGVGLLDAATTLEAETAAARVVEAFASGSSRMFSKAVRSELWMADLALKREALRLGALQCFAALAGDQSPSESEMVDARRTICRLRAAMQWSVASSELNRLGLSDVELEQMTRELALARRAARPVIASLDGRVNRRASSSRVESWRSLGLDFQPSPKGATSNRFSLPLSEAQPIAERIAKQMGVVRIGLIGQLDTLGIHVAQAFGARTGWSSSFSSGKAETREGARVGSIMEEAELHAQDAFQPSAMIRAAYRKRSEGRKFIDPTTLGLPFDSRYTDSLEIDWLPCTDVLACEHALVPSACLIGDRVPNDIYYSPRLGGKIFSSSGLGSGFTLAEAAVHAAAECIERHALRLAEIELDNPGGVGARRFWFVDLDSLPETPRRIADKYRAAGMCVRILDITSEIAVPTFFVRVFDDPFESDASKSSDGSACHPDPEVAVTMALLEAAQTKAGVIAGGREDYSLQARSLGRHERPRTMVPQSQVFWFCNDRPARPLGESRGYRTNDILDEFEWIVDRVEDAGYERALVADYTMARIRPAHAVRVVIPGSETTNPLYTGLRARATLIRDLLPRR